MDDPVEDLRGHVYCFNFRYKVPLEETSPPPQRNIKICSRKYIMQILGAKIVYNETWWLSDEIRSRRQR